MINKFYALIFAWTWSGSDQTYWHPIKRLRASLYAAWIA